MTNNELEIQYELLKNLIAHYEAVSDGYKKTFVDIKAKIENYRLSDDEKVDMDEDSIKWGMKIACEIIDNHIGERSE